MADYEVKVVPKFDLNQEDRDFILNKIKEIADESSMELHDDKITYSKKKPYKKLEDIPAGFTFYNRLTKYKSYLTALEYYSYLEGDINGRIVGRKK